MQTSPFCKDSAIASLGSIPNLSAPTASDARIRPTSAPTAAAVAQALESSRTLTLFSVAPNPSSWLGRTGAVPASPERSGARQVQGGQ